MFKWFKRMLAQSTKSPERPEPPTLEPQLNYPLESPAPLQPIRHSPMMDRGY